MGMIEEEPIEYCERWSKAEKEIVIDIFTEAIISHVSISAKYLAKNTLDKMFDQVIKFGAMDRIYINFSIETTGNDLITALGAARRQIKKKGGDNQNVRNTA